MNNPNTNLNCCSEVVFCVKWLHITPVLAALHWLFVRFRVDFKVVLIAYKAFSGLAPSYLNDILIPYIPRRPLRSQDTGFIYCP